MKKGSTKTQIQKWNRHKVHILGAPHHSYEGQIELLKKAGLEVELSTTIPDLYQSLCNAEPGAVLISSSFSGPAGMMAPEFVHRRFGVPVVLFAEKEDAPVSRDWEMETVPDEIVIVNSMNPEDLLTTIHNWEEKVLEKKSNRLKKRAGITSSSKADYGKLIKAIGAVLGETGEAGGEAGTPSEAKEITVCSLLVPHTQGRGAFIFSFPSGTDLEKTESLEEVLTLIKAQLGTEPRFEVLTEKADAEMIKRLKNEADHVTSGTISGSGVVVAFIENLPQDFSMQEQPQGENQWLVPIEDWWSEIALPCEVKLWLEQNQRTVLYVRTGRKILNESVNRLKKAGVSQLCVPTESIQKFRDFRDLIQWMSKKDEEERTAA